MKNNIDSFLEKIDEKLKIIEKTLDDLYKLNLEDTKIYDWLLGYQEALLHIKKSIK